MIRTTARRIFSFLLIATLASLARTNLTGRILDENGAVVAEAALYMTNALLTVTTDEEGRFDFSRGQSARPHHPRIVESTPAIINGTLRLSIDSDNTPVRIELLGVNGRKLSTFHAGRVSQGVHLFDLNRTFSGPPPGTGIYCLQIQIGFTVHRTIVVRTENGFLPGRTPRVQSGKRGLHKTATGPTDTLIVIKEGFQTATFVLDSAVGDAGSLFICSDTGYPRVIIAAGDLRILIYLPDEDAGYYRSSRFDWSGMIGSVRHGDVTWYAQWRSPHDPQNPEHGIGPADEFDMNTPPGFSTAAPGQSFMKIGVGALKKTGGAYAFNTEYPITDPGVRTVYRGPDWACFTHELTDIQGYGYRYTKTLRLSGDSSRLAIIRHLTNTGTHAITTEQYTHNFTILDEQPIGPAYRMTFGFNPTIAQASPSRWSSIISIEGNTINFLSPVPANSLWLNLGGLTDSVQDNLVRIEHTTLGASLTIAGDIAPHRFVIWSVPGALCPEPFVNISVPQGQSSTWTTTYTFSRF